MGKKLTGLYQKLLFYKANNKKQKWDYPNEIKSIWIIRLRHLGDLLMVSPFPKLIKEKYPNAKVTMVVNKQFADVWKFNSCVNKIIEVNTSNDYVEINKIIDLASMEKIDLLLSLDCSSLGALIGANCPAKWSIGILHSKIYKNAWTFSFKKHGIRRVELFKSIANVIGLNVNKWKQEIFWCEQDEKAALELLKTFKSKLKIGFIPWTSKIHKNWGLTETVRFNDLLFAKGYIPIILGSPSDRLKADAFMEKVVNKPYDLVGKTSILQLAALIKNLDIIVTCDTATAHLAAIFNKPTIVLYGPTSEEIWKPDSENIITISGKRCIECTPLIRYFGHIKKCPQKGFECMNIKSEEVIKALESIVEEERLIKII